MEQYNVTGMSCAACSSRVEKAVRAVDGVESVSVSLLTNSMIVEGTADSGAVIAAVEHAGYGASKKGLQEQHSASDQADALADKETPKMKRRLIASLLFLVPLIYLSMGHMMWNWPVGSFLANNMLAQGITLNVVQADSFEQYQQAVQSGDFELYIGEVKLYNNIDLGPFWAGGTLSAGLAQSEELAAAYSAFKANKSAAGQFEQAFAAQMPYIPLLWRYNTVISGFGVQGLSSSVSNIFYSLADLTVTAPG